MPARSTGWLVSSFWCPSSCDYQKYVKNPMNRLSKILWVVPERSRDELEEIIGENVVNWAKKSH